MELKTRIVYKNKKLETVSECVYPLRDYADMLSLDLKRIITDVEDLLYSMNDNRPKEEWKDAELSAFNKIKHKILDKAGEIERLPENIFDSDVMNDSVSAFWDKLNITV